MTITTTTKGQEPYLPALPEISITQVIRFLSQPTGVDVSDALVALWAESTPQHAEDGYATQARILAAILDRHVDRIVVADALEAVGKIWALENGACIKEMYNWENTDKNRDYWLNYEHQCLTIAASALGGAA